MATVNDDNVGDFTNDLASDIGPLLALFGENMTIQYLSESTSFLDYFIFAMAPIGIITAIVSTIRLCGHASFRAFIGRSQEGEGAVESELCTSTSRDVCELFTKGGVQRVLGRPSILELVYIDHDGDTSLTKASQSNDEAGLYLSRNYFEDHTVSENAHWKRIDSIPTTQPRGKPTNGASFAPNPNLSLNVGVRKQPSWVFWVIAVTGLILQVGVAVLAGVGVWILGWNLNESEGSAKNYAPIMYVSGTVMLCFGMWSCAALIGQTTDEIRFKRLNLASAHQSRLLWLQPGPQIIGDQSFDPFAYFEDTKKDPLRVWTSSSKSFPDVFELYTVFAIVITLAGYVVQFIGLRGMKGWVSLAQLGITIVMSLLRGLLRIKRLGRNDNKLGTMPDLVAGHELDWLASNIVSRKPQEDFFWHITGQYENAYVMGDHKTDSISEPNADGNGSMRIRSDSAKQPTQKVGGALKLQSSALGDRLFQVRVRLAHLTGNIFFRKLHDSEYQVWEDEYVNVRVKAREVATAICTAAANLSKDRQEENVVLCIGASSISQGNQSPSHTQQAINITLKPPPAFSTAGWRLDSAQLEAALGLWMWAMISDERLLENDNDKVSQSLADKVQPARIISAGVDNDDWDADVNIQSEMDLWLGRSATSFREAILDCQGQSVCGLATLFEPSPVISPEKASIPKFNALGLRDEVRSFKDIQRFCGWANVHGGLDIRPSRDSTKSEATSQSSYTKVKIQFSDLASTDTSLLDLGAQELFTALMLSLASFLPLGSTKLGEDAGKLRLENDSVNVFVNAFQEAGLGASSDAMLCVVPALRQKLAPLDSEGLLLALCSSAVSYRQASEWERAETVLLWACRRFAPQRSKTPHQSRHFVRALLATAELYRWSLAQSVWKLDDPSAPSRKRFGMNGIGKLLSIYGQDSEECQSLLGRYCDIGHRLEQDQNSENTLESRMNRLTDALFERDRSEALYQLCFIPPQVVRFADHLRSALPLAVRNDWSEVVHTLLEMKANANSTSLDRRVHPDDAIDSSHLSPEAAKRLDDERHPDDQRTALSYCAEYGHDSYLKPLLEHGAAIDEPAGRLSRSPLLYAAKHGHISTVRLLLASGRVNVNRQDITGISSLVLASKNGDAAVVQELLSIMSAKINTRDNLGWTPLMQASLNGHQRVAQQLLAKGARLDLVNNEDNSALLLAARQGHVNIVEILLDHGADIESKDQEDLSALSIAVVSGYFSVVKLLLSRGADVESRAKNDYTPLLHAIEHRQYDVARLLAESGANTNYLISPDTESRPAGLIKSFPLDITPLFKAMEIGDERLVDLMIEKGADIEWREAKQGATPLLIAVQDPRPEEEIARLLVRRGANVGATDSRGRTTLQMATFHRRSSVVPLLLEKNPDLEARRPLYEAASRGYAEITRMLLEKGADPNPVRDEELYRHIQPPLFEALCRGYTEIAMMLLEKGANPNPVEDGTLHRPLFEAASRGYPDCVRMLLEKGARIDQKLDLLFAAQSGHVECVRILVEHGAQLEARNRDGETALYLATQRGEIDCVRLLVEKGAQINEAEALHVAAQCGKADCMRFLLQNGAHVEAQNSMGQTPLHLAALVGQLECVQVLIDNGAKLEARDSSGQTSLHMAAAAANRWTKAGRKKCVMFLLEKGAILETVDDSGDSAAAWVERDYEPAEGAPRKWNMGL